RLVARTLLTLDLLDRESRESLKALSTWAEALLSGRLGGSNGGVESSAVHSVSSSSDMDGSTHGVVASWLRAVRQGPLQ
ncbi:hypothetical protein MTO96_050316, partial [Rhipicephalus appendiculatus]